MRRAAAEQERLRAVAEERAFADAEREEVMRRKKVALYEATKTTATRDNAPQTQSARPAADDEHGGVEGEGAFGTPRQKGAADGSKVSIAQTPPPQPPPSPTTHPSSPAREPAPVSYLYFGADVDGGGEPYASRAEGDAEASWPAAPPAETGANARARQELDMALRQKHKAEAEFARAQAKGEEAGEEEMERAREAAQEAAKLAKVAAGAVLSVASRPTSPASSAGAQPDAVEVARDHAQLPPPQQQPPWHAKQQQALGMYEGYDSPEELAAARARQEAEERAAREAAAREVAEAKQRALEEAKAKAAEEEEEGAGGRGGAQEGG